MPAYYSEAIEAGFVEAGFPSPPIDDESLRKMYTFGVTVPIVLLVSGLALSLQSDLVTDMYIALSSILSAFLLCVFWWSA